MKNYKHEATRPVVQGKHMDYMCPSSHDFCECAEDVVEDGIVMCGKPAAVIRVLARTSDMPGYICQCISCYYETRHKRRDPSIPALRQLWGKIRVELKDVSSTDPADLPGLR